MANRVVLGELPGGGLGLRISRPGYNVLDAALRDDRLSFDSRWPAAMRLIKSGAATTGSSGSVTISYGQTVAVEPMCFVVTKTGGGYYIPDGNGVRVRVRKDSMIISGLPDNYTFSYYVFAQ